MVSVVAVLISLAVVQPDWRGRVLVMWWGPQLEHVDGDRAPEFFRRLLSAGDRGIGVIVEGLGSTRPGVAQAARMVLNEAIEQWDRLPRDVALRRAIALSRALADRVDRLPAYGRGAAADLAEAMLRRPIDITADNSGQVLADCQTVLRSRHTPTNREVAEFVARDRSANPGDVTNGATVPLVAKANAPATTAPRRSSPVVSLEGREALAHDDTISHDEAQRPSTSVYTMERHATSDSDRSTGDAGRPLRQPARLAGDQESAAQPEEFRTGPPGALPLPRDGFAESTPARLGPSDRPPRASRAMDPVVLASLDVIEVLRYSHRDPDAVAAARTELSRRGFTPRQIEFGRHLTSEDVHTRLRAIEQLPQTGGIDPVPWLLLLSRDPEPDVRHTAIALLATTNDARVLKRLVAIARDDPDPRVQQALGRIMSAEGAPKGRP